MSVREIQRVIFDAGQVLVGFDNRLLFDNLAKKSEEPDKHTPKSLDHLIFEWSDALVYPFERGEWSGTQFFEAVRDAINAPRLTEAEFFRIWDDIFQMNPGIDRMLALIHPSVRKLVLSNTNQSHWAKLMRDYRAVFAHFPDEDQVLSYRTWSRKPERRIFQAALDRADVAPSRIVYIDDRHENLAAFGTFGVRTLHYDLRKDNVGVLTRKLRELGVVI